jgi:hypothetical protein
MFSYFSSVATGGNLNSNVFVHLCYFCFVSLTYLTERCVSNCEDETISSSIVASLPNINRLVLCFIIRFLQVRRCTTFESLIIIITIIIVQLLSSPFVLLTDVNEWINNECAECTLPYLNIRDCLTRSHPSKGENRNELQV